MFNFAKPTTKKLNSIELKENLLSTISTEINLNTPYILLLVFSSIIATLGLLTDSPAVVIGAMLISPLAWPMLGLAASITTTRKHLAKRSIINLLATIPTVFLVSFIVASITPLNQITPEILARTDPTLLDLFIALATAVIAILAVYYPRISSSATGVAVSVALLPPLCVTGIGFASKSTNIVQGSLLLFTANLAAIVFAGALTLYLLGFKPKKESDQKRFSLGLLISSIFIVGLSIPLAFYLGQTLEQTELKNKITKELNSQISQTVNDARIEDVGIRFSQTSPNLITISANLFLPEGTFLTVSQQNLIADRLAQISNKHIDLQLNVVNSLLLRRNEDENIKKLRQQISQFIDQHLSTLDPPLQAESISINFTPTQITTPVQVLIELKQFDQIPLNLSQKQQLESALSQAFDFTFNLDIELLPVRRLDELNHLAQLESIIQNSLENNLKLVSSQIHVINISTNYTPDQLSSLESTTASSSAILGIQSLDLTVTLLIPQNTQLRSNDINQLEQTVTNATGLDTRITANLVRFQSL